jgi:phosphate transport system substrate-binding protein
MKRFLHLSVVALIIAGMTLSMQSCGGKKETKNITISGAFALYPLAVKWAEEYQKLHPDVHIDVSAGGAGKGMTDVLSDVVDLGMVSREVYAPELEKGALPIAVAKDAVVITMNADNPLAAQIKRHGISREAATKIWITGEYTTWGQVLGTNDQTPIHVYTRSDACGAAETFALWMGKKQEDLLGTAVFGDPGLASAIQNDPLGIGLNNIGYAYDEKARTPNPGLFVCPIDRDDNAQVSADEYFYDTKDDFIAAVAKDKYPSPPARDLYMVAHGTPQNEVVVDFLKFILTDGQKYNVPVGYISLTQEKLDKGLNALKVK